MPRHMQVDKPDVMRFKAGKLKQAGAAVSLQDTAAPFPLQAGSYAALHSGMAAQSSNLLKDDKGQLCKLHSEQLLPYVLHNCCSLGNKSR